MEQDFYRLFTLVTNIGGGVLRDVIQQLYQTDGIYNFQTFLDKNKHELFHQWIPNKDCCSCNYKSDHRQKPILTKIQWVQLFQLNGNPGLPHKPIGECPCKWLAIPLKEIEKLDVTISCLILKVIYSSKLNDLQKTSIEHIQKERNELAHAKTVGVESFDSRWNKLKVAMLDLVTEYIPNEKHRVDKEIETLKTKCLAKEELNFVTEIFRDMKQGMEEIGSKLDRLLEKQTERDTSIVQGSDCFDAFSNTPMKCVKLSDRRIEPTKCENVLLLSSSVKSIPVEYNPAAHADENFRTQYSDIKTTESMISKHISSIPSAPEDGRIKMEAFVDAIKDLSKFFSKSRSEDEIEHCKDEYELTLGEWDVDSLEICWGELFERYISIFNQADYVVLDENAWKELKEDNFTPEQIKKEDRKRQNKIDQKIKRAIISSQISENPQYFGELRIVIVGKTGVGKSALGNLIIGIPNFFDESSMSDSSTMKSKEGKCFFNNRSVRILDTPGLFDTNRSREAVQIELAKCLSIFNNGFHAMAVVMNGSNPRYTNEEEKAVLEVKQFFGEKIFRFCFLVLTHMDGLDEQMSSQRFLDETQQENFKKLIHIDFGGRIMFIDNRAKCTYEQNKFKTAFLGMVNNIQNILNGKVYDHELFDEAKAICQEIKAEEERRVEQQTKEEIKKVIDITKFLRTEAENATVKLLALKTGREIRQIDDFESEEIKTKVVNDVTESLSQERKDYLQRLPDKNLMLTICLEVIEKIKESMADNAGNKQMADHLIKEKVRIIKLKNESRNLNEKQLLEEVQNDLPEPLVGIRTEDISLEIRESEYDPVVNEQITTVRHLTNDLHEKIIQIAENYFERISTEQIERLNKGDDNSVVRAIMKTLTGEIPDNVKHYFTIKAMEAEVRYKIRQEKEKLIKLQKTARKVPQPNAACFPSDAIIHCTRGSIKVSDLSIGDIVLTYDKDTDSIKYENVILLGHADHDLATNMLKITTICSKVIELSSGHLVHVNHFGNLIPARKMKRGDNLTVFTGESFVWSKVSDISVVTKTGLFCPHTANGSIVVNDIVVGCGTEHVSTSLTNALIYAVNVLYDYLPFSVFMSLYGKNRKQDVPYLLAKLRPIYFKMKKIKFFRN